MSATMDNSTDWQAEVLDLKRQGMTSAQIAEVVGKHAATVRKVIARANTERHVSGTGPYLERGDDDPADASGEVRVTADEPQGDIERAAEKPEDPLHAFKAEAGEAVGDMPKQPEPDPHGYEARVKGTRQMALDFGAEELPVGGTLKLKSDKLASGFYGLGDVITGTFTARVVDVAGAERLQRASEEFRVQPQGHVALITEIKLS